MIIENYKKHFDDIKKKILELEIQNLTKENNKISSDKNLIRRSN